MNITRVSSVIAFLGAFALSLPAAADVDFACSASGGTNCQATIPDFPIGPLTSTFTVSATAAAACSGNTAGVGIRVNLVHDNVGDLTITATGPAGTATLIDRPPGAFVGGCAGDDILATFTSLGGPPNSCTEGALPAITGLWAPVSGAAALNVADPAGPWSLTVTDNSNGFEGFLQDWSVVVQCPPMVVPTQSPLGLLALMLALATLGAVGLGAFRRRR